MSTQEQNADIVRRAYDAFSSADAETLMELFDDNVSWHTPGRSYIGGDYHGKKATLTQLGRFMEDTGGSFKALLQDVATSENGGVISIHRNTGERNGKQLDVVCSIVFEVEDGKITYGRENFFDLYAWDEFWS